MTIQYDRAMIDLVREIRKHLTGDDKLGVKLANPELLSELFDRYHQANSSVVLKTLIHELFRRAGDGWAEKLTKKKPEKRYISKQYRGSAQLVEAPTQKEPKSQSTPRIYRGQVIKA